MKKILLFSTMLFSAVVAMAQVDVKNGPNLENDRDNKMNRMLGGDENSFYCYRIRSKGAGTSYFVEKYDKNTLKPIFSKELPVEQERLTKIEDVRYAENTVYIFVRSYDKKAEEMTLYYQSVSSTGNASSKKIELATIKSDHYEFVDFKIYPNPSNTKFLIKAFHKASKDAKYKTDFMLYGAKDMKKIWEKDIDEKVGSKGKSITFNPWSGFGLSDNDVGFIGLYLDDKDNVYYATSYYAKNSTDKVKRYKAAVSILESASEEPVTTELTFEDDYLVKDVEFSFTPNKELVVGGFIKDVIERKGRDLVQVGIFSFTMNPATGEIISKAVNMFNDELLTRLESNPKRSRYFKYKLDYIIPIGKDVFYIGEQYQEVVRTSSSSSGSFGVTSSSTYYDYEYMDVIVAKLNADGKFEWIKNTPLRNSMTLNFPHVFKQYIAVPTENSIYIINNEHEKNINIYDKDDFEPKDLKTMSGIHGSNFVYNTVSISNGAIKHGLIFNNEEYCFAPIQERNPQFMPPESTEIFVMGGPNEIFIYTEDRGKDRFTKLVLK
jgi:hypothetical protein